MQPDAVRITEIEAGASCTSCVSVSWSAALPAGASFRLLQTTVLAEGTRTSTLLPETTSTDCLSADIAAGVLTRFAVTMQGSNGMELRRSPAVSTCKSVARCGGET